MAIDFNATTTKAEHTTASGLGATQFTVAAWVNVDGTGEGATGRLFCLPEGAAEFMVRVNATDVLRFSRTFSVTAGIWTFPVTFGGWRAIAVTYDDGSALNDPTGRVDFGSVTMTETQTPVGTANAAATGYCVGNASAQNATWDGGIAHFQIWDRLLSTAEQDQALQFPGSVTSGLQLWLPLYTSTYNLDLATAGPWNSTLTGAAAREPGPSLEDYWKSQQYDGFMAHAALRM